jgi:hypothetical protein
LDEDTNGHGNTGPTVWLGNGEHYFASRPYDIKKAEGRKWVNPHE